MSAAPFGSMFPPYKTASVAELIPYARNARTHSDAQVAQIAASIREFGFTNPILVDGERGVIAGHGRLMAARKLGLTEVPTIELSHLTPAQRRAYILADNKLALNAGWDDDLLRFDLGLASLSLGEIGKLLIDATEGLTDPDEIPPVPEQPVSQLRDVWILGRHRLACGDSTDPETVAQALTGVCPHLMVTDPPYGVDYDPASRNQALEGPATKRTGRVLNDHRSRQSSCRAVITSAGWPALSTRIDSRCLFTTDQRPLLGGEQSSDLFAEVASLQTSVRITTPRVRLVDAVAPCTLIVCSATARPASPGALRQGVRCDAPRCARPRALGCRARCRRAL
ncbi:ParB N-terminal domain-containing protein [Falsiroseomonas sp. HW251]|uniref:ParB/Srx family N-terminal domain-containing protein n=1 Tax=Falsiroseomonas sp. HW251 TaxID=3390998 RepID=UPI003D31AC4A